MRQIYIYINIFTGAFPPKFSALTRRETTGDWNLQDWKMTDCHKNGRRTCSTVILFALSYTCLNLIINGEMEKWDHAGLDNDTLVGLIGGLDNEELENDGLEND